MASDDTDAERRKFLKAIGATGAMAGVAGCGGDGGDGDDGTDTTTTEPTDTTTGGPTDTTGTDTPDDSFDKTPVEEFFTSGLGTTDPSIVQFSPHNGQNRYGWGEFWDNWTQFHQGTGEFESRIVEDWDITEESTTWKVNTDYKWKSYNGEEWEVLGPVTAEDVSMELWMRAFYELPIIENQIAEPGAWEVKDDETIEIQRSSEGLDFNDRIFAHRMLRTRQRTSRFNWGDHVEELRNLSNDAKDVTNSDFNSYMDENVNNRNVPLEEVTVNGRYLWTGRRAKRAVELKFNEDYPRWAPDKVQKLDEVKTGSGREQRIQMAIRDELDYVPGPIPTSLQDQLGDHWFEAFSEGLGGGGTWYNLNDPWLGKSEVRRAVRFTVDNVEVVRNQNRTPVPSTPSGIPNVTMRDNWIGHLIDSYQNYDPHKNEIAARLMREAGAQRNSNDMWTDATGEVLNFPIKAISNWTGAMIMNDTIASHLQEFGIKSSAVGIESSTFFENHWTDEGMEDFKMLKYPVFGEWGVWAPSTFYGAYYWGDRADRVGAKGREFSAPATIGDPNSALKRYNPTEMTEELVTISDPNEQRDIVERLSWIFNQTIPLFANNKPGRGLFYASDGWNHQGVDPDEIDPRNPPADYAAWSFRELIPRGTLTPKFQEDQ